MAVGAQVWTEPGAHEVAPGVHRIPLPMPNDGLRAVNVYAIEDGDDVVLIDSGWNVAQAREQLQLALNSLGYQLRDVRRFLVTHVHRDHYTLGVALRDEYGIPITLGEGERHSLSMMMNAEGDAQLGALTRWGAAGELAEFAAGYDPEIVRQAYGWPDEWLGESSEIQLNKRVLRAIPTPGHTHGHVVYCDEDSELMFSGDHVLPHITPSIGLEPALASSPLGDYVHSLALLRQYPDMYLLPAHGPVTESVHERVGELELHHDRRLEATVATVRDGAVTVYDSAGMLGWTRRERSFADLEQFNQFLAVTETAAHLELLVRRGELSVSTVGGVDHYALGR